jgi:hypothetical protein
MVSCPHHIPRCTPGPHADLLLTARWVSLSLPQVCHLINGCACLVFVLCACIRSCCTLCAPLECFSAAAVENTKIRVPRSTLSLEAYCYRCLGSCVAGFRCWAVLDLIVIAGFAVRRWCNWSDSNMDTRVAPTHEWNIDVVTERLWEYCTAVERAQGSRQHVDTILHPPCT